MLHGKIAVGHETRSYGLSAHVKINCIVLAKKIHIIFFLIPFIHAYVSAWKKSVFFVPALTRKKIPLCANYHQAEFDFLTYSEHKFESQITVLNVIQ